MSVFSLTSLPSDMLSLIISFIDTKSCTSFMRICKDMYKHGKMYGFSKEIHADFRTNLSEFINRFCQHSDTLRYVSIRDLQDPHLWLPSFLEVTSFIGCTFNNKINPNSRQCPEKVIVLIVPENVIINKNKFINMKSLIKSR